MAEQVRGVVSREKGAPVTLETILVPDPGPGEAKVKVQACGVCHTDLHYREGWATRPPESSSRSVRGSRTLPPVTT
jgi:Zn-dependent alcohol dehydrogenase